MNSTPLFNYKIVSYFMRVLVFSAHPDDLDFGCSGTIAKWTKKGKEVYYCILTDGCKGKHTKISDHEIVKIRENEQRNAAKLLGVKDVIFLREKDGELQNTKELRKNLVKVIRQIKPDIVMCFDPANRSFDNFYRFHRDHRISGEIVFDAVYPDAGSDAFFPELTKAYPPYKIKEAWFYATDKPNVFVDISKTINKKLEALKQHKSQIKDFTQLEERIKSWARDFGKRAELKYAEGFRKIVL